MAKTIEKVKNWILPPIHLTEQEQKAENIVKGLLKKETTSIRSDLYTNSFILSNRELDFHIEINGSITIAKSSTTTSDQFRLTFVEHLKKFVMDEESRRYKADKELIFRKSLSQLDEMEKELNK